MRRARVKSTRNRFPSSQRLDVDARGSPGAPACSSSAAGRDHRRRRFCFPRDVTHGCLVRRLASVAKGPRGGFDVGRADSVYLIGGPVYRDCSVDVRAVAVQPTPRLDYQPTSRPTGSAFERGAERVIQSTDPLLATAIVASLPQWRFEPAREGGRYVRQIFRQRTPIAYQVVVVPAGQAPRRPSGATRPPAC